MKARKKKIQFRIGYREKEIIEKIGAGALVLASLIAPNLPKAVKSISQSVEEIQKILENLEKKNVIYLGGEKIRLTLRGKELLEKIYLSDIKIPEPKKWDRIWWLVSYDVPRTYNKSRNNFRSLLKIYGFYQVQESLWVYPYKCKEEIATVAHNLNISAFVIVMETDHLPNEEDMEDYFHLKS